MMIEEKLLSSMINAEQRNNYVIAAHYAYCYTKFLEIPKDSLPQKPIMKGEYSAMHASFLQYYFDLLLKIIEQAGENLKIVRKKYGKTGATADIPIPSPGEKKQ